MNDKEWIHIPYFSDYSEFSKYESVFGNNTKLAQTKANEPVQNQGNANTKFDLTSELQTADASKTADRRLFVFGKASNYPPLTGLIAGQIKEQRIEQQWNNVLRLATSIKKGTVTASLILKKLAAYPLQNGLAMALRELGRLERTIFALRWIEDLDLRRKASRELNKGEARNALGRAVFFNRLGEIRDRSFENHRYRASGLNLLTAAIVLWNTVYLAKAVEELDIQEDVFENKLLQHVAPLGWEHVNLTGDYVWDASQTEGPGLRPLRIQKLRSVA